MYTVTKQHIEDDRELVVLLLDQSNAYGQLDRIGMMHLVEHDPGFHTTWAEALYLYAKLLVFILTPYGLSEGYTIREGVIQGGGMDPIHFLWFTMLLAVWCGWHTTGVALRTTMGIQQLRPQAVLDNVTMFAASPGRVIQDADGLLKHGGRMNLVINADKLALLHYLGCSVLGRGAEPPQFWVLLIWLEPGISHVTWVHYDATMCLPCFVCSILPVLHFLRFDLCVL